MFMYLNGLGIAACALGLIAGQLQCEAQQAIPSAGNVRWEGQGSATISQTDQYVFHSEKLGRDLLIQVARPYNLTPISLQETRAGTEGAALYVVDAFLTFGPFATATRAMALEGLSQPAYLVAIGYPTESMLELVRQRTLDLVHIDRANVSMGMPGGGGEVFEAFLQEELRPFIESKYPIKDDASYLAGHSLGGLFTATVMATHPDAFDGYIIGSPALNLDPELATRAHAAARSAGGRRVFIGAGDDEEKLHPLIVAFEDAITGPGSEFAAKHVTFQNETHSSVMGAWASFGLRHVLRPEIKPAQ